MKNKMSLESFRRNLRGVNENTDFPEDFLNDIYYSIIKTVSRLSTSGKTRRHLLLHHQGRRLGAGSMQRAAQGTQSYSGTCGSAARISATFLGTSLRTASTTHLL